MYYIYKITNLKNGKRYIGQTNNPKRRWREHKSAANLSSNMLISKKIKQYGFENFEFTVIEEIDTENQSEVFVREQYWIEKCNSHVSTGEGYNLQTAIANSNISSRILSSSQIQEAKGMLEAGISYDEICAKFSISKTFVSDINNGKYFFEESRRYPICPYRIDDASLKEITCLLRETFMSFKDIASLVSVSEQTVKKINYGLLRPGISADYPIRPISKTKQKALIVKELAINTDKTVLEISRIAGVSTETVRRIIKGETHKDENLKYPLGKIVETIPG